MAKEKKEPTINLDVMFDGVKFQARMVHDAYAEYGKALQDYYGWMFIDPSDGSLNVNEESGKKVNDKFYEAQRQMKIFKQVFDEYKRLEAER